MGNHELAGEVKCQVDKNVVADFVINTAAYTSCENCGEKKVVCFRRRNIRITEADPLIEFLHNIAANPTRSFLPLLLARINLLKSLGTIVSDNATRASVSLN